MTDGQIPRIAVLGRGDAARAWANAIDSLGRLVPAHEALEKVDAVVVAPGLPDPFSRAKGALAAAIPVLYAAPFVLSPWQANVLRHLSLRQGVMLRFAEAFRYGPGFAFLRRALQGSEPLWQPAYIRTVCLSTSFGAGRLDTMATDQLALCDALLDWQPRDVSAAAARRDRTGDVCAAFLTIHSSNGPLVQTTVSLAEATEARQLVLAGNDCTVVMDGLDPVASLRVLRAGEADVVAASGAGASQGRFVASGHDPIHAEARAFLEALTSCHATGNADRWVRVASLWWAARQSMTYGGTVDAPVPAFSSRETEPPPLRLIAGGGKSTGKASARPALSLVGV